MTRKPPTKERPVQAGPKRKKTLAAVKVPTPRLVHDGALKVPVPAESKDVSEYISELELWSTAWPFFTPENAGFNQLKIAKHMAGVVRSALSNGNATDATWAGMRLVHAMFMAMLLDHDPITRIGVKIYRANEKVNLQRSRAALAQEAQWQAEAEKIWAKPQHTNKSCSEVAKLMAGHNGGADKIRKAIKKPE